MWINLLLCCFLLASSFATNTKMVYATSTTASTITTTIYDNNNDGRDFSRLLFSSKDQMIMPSLSSFVMDVSIRSSMPAITWPSNTRKRFTIKTSCAIFHLTYFYHIANLSHSIPPHPHFPIYFGSNSVCARSRWIRTKWSKKHEWIKCRVLSRGDRRIGKGKI